MAAITAQAKPERRHALRSPTLYGLMASGQRLDQGSAQWKREMFSAMTGATVKTPVQCFPAKASSPCFAS
jgi:hypothetical protein